MSRTVGLVVPSGSACDADSSGGGASSTITSVAETVETSARTTSAEREAVSSGG